MADTDGQDPQLTAIEGGAADAVRVFGRREEPLNARKYRRFGIEVETDDERFVEEFDAYLDPDAGQIFGLMNARTEQQQAYRAAMLIGASVRDDDGIPAEWVFPTFPAEDDDGEPIVDEESGAPLYEWHDGALMTEAELRQAIREFDWHDGSSRRRFGYIMDSPGHRVRLEALTELAEWVVGDAAARPTRRPSSSGRGQQVTRRGSGAKRSGQRR